MSEPNASAPVAGGGSHVDPTAESPGNDGAGTFEEDLEDYYLVKPKAKKAGITLANGLPDPGTYQFYVEGLSLVQLGSAECEELVDAKKQDPTVKWITTHKAAYDYLTKKGCPQSKAEPGQEMWMVHQAKEYRHKFSNIVKGLNIADTDATMQKKAYRGKVQKEDVKEPSGQEYYFIGRKIEADSVWAEALLVVTVDELWLKSAYHQRAMYKNLVADMSRVCPNSYITRAGNGLLHIRVQRPTEEELDLCALIPGIYQIGLPDPENKMMLGEVLKKGPGGVPLLQYQKGLCLMSGGIDSPVAAYRIMTRGVHIDAVHFLNSTSNTAAVIEKNRKLCARLSQIQGTFTIRFVDIQELQMAIVGVIKNPNRTLVYKWFMLHLSAIMDKDNKVLITGDSLGQVASQTLTNLSSLYPGLRKPVMPPLMGMNKKDIMDEARKIGTYELSIVQAADCCQFMMRKSQANLTIDTWTLYGEIAKVLRHTMPDFLPVSVDTFKEGKLVSSTTEKFPFKQNAPMLYEVIDAKGRMGLNPMIGYHRSREEAEATDLPDDPANSGPVPLVAGDKMELANKYFGVEVPATSIPDNAATDDKEMSRAQRRLVASGTLGGNQGKAAQTAAAAAAGKHFYFDSAAGTQICREASNAMAKAPEGNPTSLHASGRAARAAIEKVRAQVAAMIGKPANNVIFTSGGTEANAIALHGFHVQREDWSHSSTKATDDSISGNAPTVKVIDLVHHETGSIASNDMLKRPTTPGGRLHLDACQALGKIQMKNFDLSQVDSMTLNSHKIHGPQGVGALYVKDIASLKPLWIGGGQEFGLRPGTENVPGIVGFGAALQAAEEHLAQEQADYQEHNINKASRHGGNTSKTVPYMAIVPQRRSIENFLISRLKTLGCEVNSRGETSGYIVHATLPPNLKLENSDIVNALSTQYKLEIGTGSACNSNVENTTTYETLGVSPVPTKRSIRLSFDRYTTMDDANYAANALATIIGQNTKK